METTTRIFATSLCGCPIHGRSVFHEDDCEHAVRNTAGWVPMAEHMPLKDEILDTLMSVMFEVAARTNEAGTSYPLQIHGLPRDIFDSLPGEERAVTQRPEGEDFWSKNHPMHYWDGDSKSHVALVFFTNEPPKAAV